MMNTSKTSYAYAYALISMICFLFSNPTMNANESLMMRPEDMPSALTMPKNLIKQNSNHENALTKNEIEYVLLRKKLTSKPLKPTHFSHVAWRPPDKINSN
jgi:hypothetical protein